MRPVLLEMTGFACFREPTTISFADVDYFALVGATGSGKSTVIDAMIFALYGSVPRWDDRRMVNLALAPTVNRGTVRLVFDVGTERYVIARELRRLKNRVLVRNVRLERLDDPASLGAEDDPTEVLASDSAATKRVEQILGLTFDNFCTCVVLPQGDFADFLHAKPADRQKILTNLLGLGVYEEIAKQAGKEASTQAQRAQFLAEQLDEFASATPEAASLATQRVEALTVLSERVGGAVGQFRAASTTVSEADATIARIIDERSRLEALAIPEGLAELDSQLRAAGDTLASARTRASAAEAADTAARQRCAAAPPRGPLEQARRDHADLADAQAAEPAARQHHEQATAALTTATETAKRARAAVELAHLASDDAADALAGARARIDQLTNERDRLAGLTTPEGLDTLDSTLHTAQNALDTAHHDLRQAETTELAARSALAAAPERGPLDQARRDHAALAAALSKQSDLEQAYTAAAQHLDTANANVLQAQRLVEQTREERQAAGRADMVAELRPHLVTGELCPVCEQTVVTLPKRPPAADLAQADAAVKAAEQELTALREAQSKAARIEQQASSRRDVLAAEIAQLRRALDGAPATAAATESQLATLDQLAAATHQADQRARAARTTRDEATETLTAIRAQLATANQQLRTARDPLVSLGAPEVGDHAPTGWLTLSAWADLQRALRDEQLVVANSDLATAELADTAAAAALQAAAEHDEHARSAETAAARAEQQALSDLRGLISRIETLQTQLSGAPSDAVAAAQLAHLDELDAAAHTASQELLQARAAHTDAQDTVAKMHQQVSAEWTRLRDARDPLVPLGAPSLTDDELLTAWTALTTWADQQITVRGDRLAQAHAAATTARHHRDQLHLSLAEDLRSHEVPYTGEDFLVTDPVTAVATTLERARGEQARIAADQAQAERLSVEYTSAQRASQVARMLAHLLRSDGFPRWLVASALDTLVVDASASLLELSGGQFELTHDDGEFLVIDHTDADSHRPVKTLSGGETFQASLALALALSEQIATLAAAGAPHLDSIFLDEGFGTLDESTLDIVAATLENLATTRNRMVGVITHVGALADRIPTRFTISRNQHTSTITEGT